jgi:hypothetical protein
MRVWFCRDDDGDASVWDVGQGKPEYEMGKWKDFEEDAMGCIAETSEDVFAMFGKGYRGVKKGKCVEMELEKVK